jgi:VCBS repeat-containing protein
VTITVTPVNDAPVAVADFFSVGEGGTLTVAARGVLLNDSDVDNLPAELTASLIVGSGPQFGVLHLNADGSLTYTHDGSETVSDSFRYRVFDGVDFSDPTTVTITIDPVNDMPTITSLPPTTATAGTRYTYGVNAVDPDPGDVLTFSLQTFPAGMTINAATGLIEWTPTAAQAGTQTVTVRVTDLAGSFKEQTFTITVEAVVCDGDLDGDGDRDLDDLNVILRARNTNACGPHDCRDVDGDGRITVLDARKWVVQFLH